MTERFELTINSNGQLDIIDHIESRKRNAICIYNDLGVHPFSSAKAVCDKLNEQDIKIKKLKKSRAKWEALAENFNAFYNCYEKAINEVCDQETIDKIETAYAEHEKQVELK